MSECLPFSNPFCLKWDNWDNGSELDQGRKTVKIPACLHWLQGQAAQPGDYLNASYVLPKITLHLHSFPQVTKLFHITNVTASTPLQNEGVLS